MKYVSGTQSAFTLVETLVAVSILLIVIVGPMQISSTAARSTSFSSEQVVAFFLAQEGAEIVQKVRDGLILNSFLDVSDPRYEATPWARFIDPATSPVRQCYSVYGCGAELSNNAAASLRTPLQCVFGACRLYYDADGGRARYTHVSSGNQVTEYTRTVQLERIDANQVKVTSRVYWQAGTRRQVQEAVVETYLFNVYGN